MTLKNVISSAEPEVGLNDVNRITAGTHIKGEISSDCDIRIDGCVEGKIYSKSKVVVGTEAHIDGGLACEVVDIWGVVNGDVYAKDVITLKSKSSVNGSINTNKLQVEMGAQLNGSCKMISADEFNTICEKFVTTEPVSVTHATSKKHKVELFAEKKDQQ